MASSTVTFQLIGSCSRVIMPPPHSCFLLPCQDTQRQVQEQPQGMVRWPRAQCVQRSPRWLPAKAFSPSPLWAVVIKLSLNIEYC